MLCAIITLQEYRAVAIVSHFFLQHVVKRRRDEAEAVPKLGGSINGYQTSRSILSGDLQKFVYVELSESVTSRRVSVPAHKRTAERVPDLGTLEGWQYHV